MRYEVVFREEARLEALDAARYIASHGSAEAALRWFDGLETALNSLTVSPARCGLAREHASFVGGTLRQLLYTSYRVLFVVLADEVHVLHVRHASRQDLDAV